MKPEILLIGRTGQLGRELNKLLPRLGAVTSLDRQQLDLIKSEEIRHVIRSIRPNLIVNAAAYTAVDLAESEPAQARAVNADAPAIMSAEANQIGACLIHYSTDYVFDGAKAEPYKEEDPTNPQNVYAQTKLEGENAIRESGAPYLIFRTAWVYATEGRNFLLTMLRLMTQREELKIVNDQTGAPTLNVEIAEATLKILSQLCARGNFAASMSGLSGIYHMTAAGETTWFHFAEEISREAQTIRPGAPWFAAATNNLPLITRRIIPIRTSEYPTPARRPAYSILSNERLSRAFSLRLPHWRDQLHSIFTAPSAQIL